MNEPLSGEVEFSNVFAKYQKLSNQADPAKFDPLRPDFVRAIADVDKEYDKALLDGQKRMKQFTPDDVDRFIKKEDADAHVVESLAANIPESQRKEFRSNMEKYFSENLSSEERESLKKSINLIPGMSDAIDKLKEDYKNPIQIAFTETTSQVGPLGYERDRYRELYAEALETAGHRDDAKALRKEIQTFTLPAYPTQVDN